MKLPANCRSHWVVLVVLFCAGHSFSQSTPAELRYKLGAGDRLVYHEVFDKQGNSPDVTFHAHVVSTNQLVVVDEAAGRSLVGVQRNRQSAELLEYHERGKDTLAQQKSGFEQRMAKRPIRFADINLFSATGQSMLPPQILREANSKLLYGIHELMPVPVTPVQVGYEWDLGVFGLRMKLERFVPLDNESEALLLPEGPSTGTSRVAYGRYLSSVARYLSANSFRTLRKLLAKLPDFPHRLESAKKIRLISEKHGALYSVSRLAIHLPEKCGRYVPSAR